MAGNGAKGKGKRASPSPAKVKKKGSTYQSPSRRGPTAHHTTRGPPTPSLKQQVLGSKILNVDGSEYQPHVPELNIDATTQSDFGFTQADVEEEAIGFTARNNFVHTTSNVSQLSHGSSHDNLVSTSDKRQPAPVKQMTDTRKLRNLRKKLRDGDKVEEKAYAVKDNAYLGVQVGELIKQRVPKKRISILDAPKGVWSRYDRVYAPLGTPRDLDKVSNANSREALRETVKTAIARTDLRQNLGPTRAQSTEPRIENTSATLRFGSNLDAALAKRQRELDELQRRAVKIVERQGSSHSMKSGTRASRGKGLSRQNTRSNLSAVARNPSNISLASRQSRQSRPSSAETVGTHASTMNTSTTHLSPMKGVRPRKSLLADTEALKKANFAYSKPIPALVNRKKTGKGSTYWTDLDQARQEALAKSAMAETPARLNRPEVNPLANGHRSVYNFPMKALMSANARRQRLSTSAVQSRSIAQVLGSPVKRAVAGSPSSPVEEDAGDVGDVSLDHQFPRLELPGFVGLTDEQMDALRHVQDRSRNEPVTLQAPASGRLRRKLTANQLHTPVMTRQRPGAAGASNLARHRSRSFFYEDGTIRKHIMDQSGYEREAHARYDPDKLDAPPDKSTLIERGQAALDSHRSDVSTRSRQSHLSAGINATPRSARSVAGSDRAQNDQAVHALNFDDESEGSDSDVELDYEIELPAAAWRRRFYQHKRALHERLEERLAEREKAVVEVGHTLDLLSVDAFMHTNVGGAGVKTKPGSVWSRTQEQLLQDHTGRPYRHRFYQRLVAFAREHGFVCSVLGLSLVNWVRSAFIANTAVDDKLFTALVKYLGPHQYDDLFTMRLLRWIRLELHIPVTAYVKLLQMQGYQPPTGLRTLLE